MSTNVTSLDVLSDGAQNSAAEFIESEKGIICEMGKRFGSNGERTYVTMIRALASSDLQCSYDPSVKKFTLLHSKDLEEAKIRQILQTRLYREWRPTIEEERDSLGNLHITFGPIDEDDTSSPFANALFGPGGFSPSQEEFRSTHHIWD